jgi:hypothetical protein
LSIARGNRCAATLGATDPDHDELSADHDEFNARNIDAGRESAASS